MNSRLEVVACLVLLTACSQALVSQPTPTSTAIPTDTPAPTSTPHPTSTPTHPPTVAPTPTIELPPVTSEFLTDVGMLSYDPFDNMNNWQWDRQTSANNNGVFEMQGTSFWASNLSLKQHLSEGEGILLSFKVRSANGQSEFVFVTGDWQTDSFRQFGIYNHTRPKADLFQGKYGLGGNDLYGNLNLHADTWYNLLMAIGENGEFLAVMWDPNSDGLRAIYNETIGERWTGKDWQFRPKANEGETLFVDDLYRFSFGEIK